MVLRPSSDEPNGTLRFRKEATTGVDSYVVGVQGLEVVIGKPSSSFEIRGTCAADTTAPAAGFKIVS